MPIHTGLDTLESRQTLIVGMRDYAYYSLKSAEKQLGDLSRLPFCLKILMENLLRYEDGHTVTVDTIQSMSLWLQLRKSDVEIAFRPARVLMQDFTGVPALVDLAALREATIALHGNPGHINPLCPVDLIIDHSMMVDHHGKADSFKKNIEREFERNSERYAFLRWGQKAFNNFRVVPPGTGICHQINLEHLAQVVWTDRDARDGRLTAYPDTLVGIENHTTMINALGVIGWNVGGIEAEAAMLGQPISLLIPEVIGIKLVGQLNSGATAMDLALTITQILKKKGVVGKFVEFFGEGIKQLSLPDRATISNMATEAEPTCAVFPIDEATIDYLKFTGRENEQIALVEAYAKEQGLWYGEGAEKPIEPLFSDMIEINLDIIEPSLAGPRLPYDRMSVSQTTAHFEADLINFKVSPDLRSIEVPVAGENYKLKHGAVVIAALTSCTNTANPAEMIAAGLLARKARQKGLTTKAWVKASLTPGSQVVSDYLIKSGLQEDLDALGFTLAGYGCATCVGNSGSLPEPVANAITEGNLVACTVTSGNRNAESSLNPQCRANYITSPALVVTYALTGSMTVNLQIQPLGEDTSGNNVFLKDVWPTAQEIAEAMAASITPEMFRRRYIDVFSGSEEWQQIKVPEGLVYRWDEASTYVKHSPLFKTITPEPEKLRDIKEARILAIFGDTITTDQISPAGAILKSSPAGTYLTDRNIQPSNFNAYGARRGNHEIMVRGTFDNLRIKNEMMAGAEGAVTKHIPTDETMSIFDAASLYAEKKTPLVIFAGKNYGTGSSRDWAAKGVAMLGVRAVIAESFDRIHRSNLIGMGVLPLEFKGGMTRATLKIDGSESIGIAGISTDLRPHMDVMLTLTHKDIIDRYMLKCRIDTPDEVEYFRHGGILHYVLRDLLKQAS